MLLRARRKEHDSLDARLRNSSKHEQAQPGNVERVRDPCDGGAAAGADCACRAPRHRQRHSQHGLRQASAGRDARRERCRTRRGGAAHRARRRARRGPRAGGLSGHERDVHQHRRCRRRRGDPRSPRRRFLRQGQQRGVYRDRHLRSRQRALGSCWLRGSRRPEKTSRRAVAARVLRARQRRRASKTAVAAGSGSAQPMRSRCPRL